MMRFTAEFECNVQDEEQVFKWFFYRYRLSEALAKLKFSPKSLQAVRVDENYGEL